MSITLQAMKEAQEQIDAMRDAAEDTLWSVDPGDPYLLCVECRVPLIGAFYDIYTRNRAGEIVCYGCVWADHEEACPERERLKRALRGTMPPRRRTRPDEQGTLTLKG